ncbi:SUMO ligase SIZ1, partial [Ascoidea rubescens DSM 1968]
MAIDNGNDLSISNSNSNSSSNSTPITRFTGISTYPSQNRLGSGFIITSSTSHKKNHPSPYTPKPWIYFKKSPFFKLKKLIRNFPQLASKAPDTRGTCKVEFSLTFEDQTSLKSNPNYRLFLLSGIYDSLKSQNNNDVYIKFPHPLEIHFNKSLIDDNVKGIKDKPGTAKPANLTKYVRDFPANNILELVYAFSKDDYLVFMYIVEIISCEEILSNIRKSNPRVLKLTTKNKIIEDYAMDDDLLGLSLSLSLICPLTYARMKYPAKSINCTHVQCFDCLNFLQLQEQAQTWSCPICSTSINVDDLAIDDYVQEVIKQTDDEIHSVQLNQDGSWSFRKETDKE